MSSQLEWKTSPNSRSIDRFIRESQNIEIGYGAILSRALD
jgi:hypothetical protein